MVYPVRIPACYSGTRDRYRAPLVMTGVFFAGAESRSAAQIASTEGIPPNLPRPSPYTRQARVPAVGTTPAISLPSTRIVGDPKARAYSGVSGAPRSHSRQ